MPAHLDDIVRDARRPAGAGALRATTVRTACRSPGAELVSTLVTGVSAHLELFERARAEGAELILTHHGLLWGSEPGPDRRRPDAPPASAVRREHEPRRLPPAAGRAPGSRQQRAAGACTGSRRAEPFALHRGAPIGVSGASPTRASPQSRAVRARARGDVARAARIRTAARELVRTRRRSSRAPARTTSPRRSRRGARRS